MKINYRIFLVAVAALFVTANDSYADLNPGCGHIPNGGGPPPFNPLASAAYTELSTITVPPGVLGPGQNVPDKLKKEVGDNARFRIECRLHWIYDTREGGVEIDLWPNNDNTTVRVETYVYGTLRLP